MKPALPFIPGHEGVGIVERAGAGNAHGIAEGMRVAPPWLGYACGDCAHRDTGWETLCESQQNMGCSMNGGFAEYAVGYARHVVAAPDGIDPLDAAPLTCAGVTTCEAQRRAVRRPLLSLGVLLEDAAVVAPACSPAPPAIVLGS